MKLIIELSGEQTDMAVSEAIGAASAIDGSTRLIEQDGRIAILDTSSGADILSERLALCWHISEYLFSFDLDEINDVFDGLDLGGKTFAIKMKRLDDKWKPEDSQAMIEKIAGVLERTGKVDLRSPDMILRVIMGEKLHAGWQLHEIDRTSFEARKGKDRPFSHPISLHPRYARAMVNLARVKPEDVLLDPFCGTGGILIEGGMIGAHIIGSDMDPRMIEGCGINLSHFLGKDNEFQLHELDVADIGKLGKVDAIATDPPYGRSASTAKEDVGELYERALEAFVDILKPGGRLAIVFPDKRYVKLASKYLSLLEVHDLFVHRSLTRYFCVFEKE
ncbi:MAG: hypothetical protein KAS16_02240 [Thermoplasmata archaeon]|nr:hypothetical protein [Thermoplasmata archaeon]